jgi:hypothetical protein
MKGGSILKPRFHGEATCQQEVHIGPESGEGTNHFSRPRYAHANITPYLESTSGHLTDVPSHSNPKEHSTMREG